MKYRIPDRVQDAINERVKNAKKTGRKVGRRIGIKEAKSELSGYILDRSFSERLKYLFSKEL